MKTPRPTIVRVLVWRGLACALIAGAVNGCGGDYVVGSFTADGGLASSGSGGSSDSGATNPLVPEHGAWWGYHSAGSSIPVFTAREADVGRTFDVAKIYHDFSIAPANAFPTADEAAFAAGGRILHVGWEARLYNPASADPGQPTALGMGAEAGDTYTYAQILGHQLDGYLDTAADHLKAFGQPLIVELNAAADDATALGGGNPYRAAAGDPAEFAAAYRYIVERFRGRGVTNVAWSMSVAGFQKDDAIYTSLYPGDDIVAWIGWGPFNHTPGIWTEPLDLFRRFYDRLDAGLLGAAAIAKPRLITEYGCMDDARRPDWIRAIPPALAALPRLKAVDYFDSGAVDALGSDPTVVGAFTTAGHDTYVNQPHGG